MKKATTVSVGGALQRGQERAPRRAPAGDPATGVEQAGRACRPAAVPISRPSTRRGCRRLSRSGFRCGSSTVPRRVLIGCDARSCAPDSDSVRFAPRQVGAREQAGRCRQIEPGACGFGVPGAGGSRLSCAASGRPPIVPVQAPIVEPSGDRSRHARDPTQLTVPVKPAVLEGQVAAQRALGVGQRDEPPGLGHVEPWRRGTRRLLETS